MAKLLLLLAFVLGVLPLAQAVRVTAAETYNNFQWGPDQNTWRDSLPARMFDGQTYQLGIGNLEDKCFVLPSSSAPFAWTSFDLSGPEYVQGIEFTRRSGSQSNQGQVDIYLDGRLCGRLMDADFDENDKATAWCGFVGQTVKIQQVGNHYLTICEVVPKIGETGVYNIQWGPRQDFWSTSLPVRAFDGQVFTGNGLIQDKCFIIWPSSSAPFAWMSFDLSGPEYVQGIEFTTAANHDQGQVDIYLDGRLCGRLMAADLDENHKATASCGFVGQTVKIQQVGNHYLTACEVVPKIGGPYTTTSSPTTKAPTTSSPTTKAPTTSSPTTKAPTTSSPTTKAPTTSSPTTKAPTTSSPTTKAPTTSSPTAAQVSCNWGSFGPCSVSCGDGSKTRTCVDTYGTVHDTDTTICNMGNCGSCDGTCAGDCGAPHRGFCNTDTCLCECNHAFMGPNCGQHNDECPEEE